MRMCIYLQGHICVRVYVGVCERENDCEFVCVGVSMQKYVCMRIRG